MVTSPPNVLFDAESLEVSGIIDAGRLGVADRWTDLALVCRSHDEASVAHFLQSCGTEHDEKKDSFYRLLDEFF